MNTSISTNAARNNLNVDITNLNSPKSRQHQLMLRVTAARWEADGVLGLTLQTADGKDLPRWEAGAHLDLLLPSGLNRRYSLCGDPQDLTNYQIAVRLEKSGRGGSVEIHNSGLVGKIVQVAPPRNHFSLSAAKEYLLIAGGIGITPIVPMAITLEQRRASWSLLYCGHGAKTMPFVGALQALGNHRVRVVDTAIDGRPDLDTVIRCLPIDGITYCCGPTSLIDAVIEICSANGVQCRTEYFDAATGPVSTSNYINGEVEVELRRSRMVIKVGPDTTLLDAIRAAGVEAESDCEEGYCGTCEVAVLEGRPDHRDVVLSEGERAAGRIMMPCVSRSQGKKLVLDL